MQIQAPKGTKDVLPGESYKWQYIEKEMRDLCRLYGINELRTPIIEHTELFMRGVGDTTDIVQKEMYTFKDKGDRSITLKPEGTAGMVRAFLENRLFNEALPQKMYYLNAPVFRYEKPQAGRLREHHQFGVEFFGASSFEADAEIIMLALSLLRRLGLDELTLHLNSIGCGKCRREYNKALFDYLKSHIDGMCKTCQDRLERNPMRILDCKSPECQEVCKGAPKITDYLCEDCKAHFAKVQEFLTALGIEFEIDPGLVRGLDYYTRTVFEFPSKSLGFALGGGGRYDGLVEEFGGKPTPGLGFGLGLDRIMMALEAQQVEFPQLPKCEMYIATMGEEAQKKAFLLLDELHRCGIPADTDLCGRGLKAQMKYAGKIGAKFTMVLGDNELQEGKAEMKNMKTGEKRKISISGEDFINDYVTVSTEAEDFSQDGIFF